MGRNALKGSTLLAAVAALSLIGMVASARGVAAQQAAQQGPERFRAVATNLARTRGPLATEVDVDVKQWSTDGQRDELLNVLRTKGEQALLDALQKQPVVGTIRTPDSLAYDLHYARSQPWGDGGQQVVIATDRYISFWEARNDTRSLDYPFTVIEMRVDNHGKGEGKMSLATRVVAAGSQIVLEDYGSQPVLLTDVTREQ